MDIRDEIKLGLKQTSHPFSSKGAQDYLERIEGLKYRLEAFKFAVYYVDFSNQLEKRKSFLEAKLREFQGEQESEKRQEIRWLERQEEKKYDVKERWPPLEG